MQKRELAATVAAKVQLPAALVERVIQATMDESRVRGSGSLARASTAVLTFQQDRGVATSGLVGGETRRLLNELVTG